MCVCVGGIYVIGKKGIALQDETDSGESYRGFTYWLPVKSGSVGYIAGFAEKRSMYQLSRDGVRDF